MEFTKGIRPDRPKHQRPALEYVTVECPKCGHTIRFVKDLLNTPHPVVLCRECKSLIDAAKKEVTNALLPKKILPKEDPSNPVNLGTVRGPDGKERSFPTWSHCREHGLYKQVECPYCKGSLDG